MKKGFVFIETIITVVVLCASLIYLYSSYSSMINNEEARVYYDDVAHLYKAGYLRDYLLNNSEIETVKSIALNDSYVEFIGSLYSGLILDDEQRTDFQYICNSFNVKQMLLISSDLISECDGHESSGICYDSYDKLSYNLRNYVKSLNDTSYDYFLVVEFSEKINDNNSNDNIGKITSCTEGTDIRCHSYYVSLAI